MGPELKSSVLDINLGWCKGCGICVMVCPKKVLGQDERGKAVVDDPDNCIKCRLCELSCPDFAITVGITDGCEVNGDE